MLLGIAVAIAGSLPLWLACTDDQLSPTELLDRYSDSLSWQDAFSMRVESDVRGEGPSAYAKGNIMFTETSIWCTGGELLYEGRRETRDREGHTYPRSSFALPTTHITAEFAWRDITPEEYPTKLLYRGSEVEKRWRAFWWDLTAGSMLDGFVPGSREQSVIDLLRASSNLLVDHEVRLENGTPCSLVQGTSDYGIVRVWLDQSHNYAAVKFSIHKEKIHLFDEVPLDEVLKLPDASPLVLWEAELVDGVLASFGETHLISSGELRVTRTHADGQVNIIHFLLRRFDIDLSPPDDAVRARFDSLLIDGTEVVDADIRGLRFEWQQGKLQPKFHPLVVSYVQNTIARYLGKQDIDPLTEPVQCTALDDAFCGLYCLYAAGQLTQSEFAFTSLLRPEYIGAAEGSSIAELERAAQDQGLYTAPFDRASLSDLESTSSPIVLYVKHKPSDPSPNHFVLFVAAKPDGAMIFEPPSESALPVVREIPYYELASIWNGKGLSLATEPIEEPKLLVSARRRFLFVVVGLLVAMSAIKFVVVKWQEGARLRTPRQLMALSVGQTGAMIAIAASLSFVFHVNARGGFFSAPDSVSFIANLISLPSPSIQTLSIEELPEALAGGSPVLIDARSPEDFASKHIPGAINIPLGVSKAHRDAKLREIPRDTLVVTYCDPNGCPLSARLAIVLFHEGFSNIRVLEGDWTIEAQSQ